LIIEVTPSTLAIRAFWRKVRRFWLQNGPMHWERGTAVCKSRHHCRGAKVFSVPTEMPAADRARWLAEVSQALDEARALLQDLRIKDGEYDLACDLNARIESARFEVQSLRLSRSLQPRDHNDPKWTKFALWPDPGPVQRPAGMSPPPLNGSRKRSRAGGRHPD